jgi:hypothetical protein
MPRQALLNRAVPCVLLRPERAGAERFLNVDHDECCFFGIGIHYAQPCGLNTRSVDAGYSAILEAGRLGLFANSPVQFGQTFLSFSSAQGAQKVHSKVHMRAMSLSNGKSVLQHSQLGRSASVAILLKTFLNTNHARFSVGVWAALGSDKTKNGHCCKK